MRRARIIAGRAATALGALVLFFAAAACDEEGQTAPARCADPPLPIFDIQAAGAPADDNAYLNDDEDAQGKPLPCITEVGHAISSYGGTSAVGTGGGSQGAASGTAGASDAGAGGS